MTPTPSEQAAAVLNLIDAGVIGWDEPEAVNVLREALKAGAKPQNKLQGNRTPLKPDELAPSVCLTKSQRDQIARIKLDLVQHGIRPERWVLDVLARGATVKYGDTVFSYLVAEEWPGYSGFTTIEKCVKVFIERKECIRLPD